MFCKTIISVHANDKSDRCVITCLENLIGNELQDAIKIYWDTVYDLVPKNNKGTRTLSWIKKSSTNTNLLCGGIDEFCHSLHKRMTNQFGAHRVPWTDTKVDSETVYGQYILPDFDMTNIIIE